MSTALATFINEETKRRGWSFRELARRGGISHTSIVNVVNGVDRAGPKMCSALSRAFDVPEERVLKLAGILQDYGEVPPEVMAWGARLNALGEDQRARALDMMERVLRLAEGRP